SRRGRWSRSLDSRRERCRPPIISPIGAPARVPAPIRRSDGSSSRPLDGTRRTRTAAPPEEYRSRVLHAIDHAVVEHLERKAHFAVVRELVGVAEEADENLRDLLLVAPHHARRRRMIAIPELLTHRLNDAQRNLFGLSLRGGNRRTQGLARVE